MGVRKLPSRPINSRAPSEPVWTSAEVFIFDVEGTLVDAMMPTLRCWRETLQIFGYDLGLAELHQLSGMDGAEMLEKLLPDAAKTTRQEILDLQG